jgi:cytochrome c-type biogenesis protein CcmH
VVCQNEALVDSPAELADAMRREIRDLMKAGKSDAEVIEFLVARYGDFVLFRPPFKPVTYLLWVGPFVFLALGGLIWYVALRSRRTFRGAPVNEAQRAAAARLLEEQS